MNKQIPFDDFIKLVKSKGDREVWASLSYHQTHPVEISNFAILRWEFDTNLYSITYLEARVDVFNMPAFELYRNAGVINQHNIDKIEWGDV